MSVALKGYGHCRPGYSKLPFCKIKTRRMFSNLTTQVSSYISPSMDRLLEYIPPASSCHPLTAQSFVVEFVPTLLFYYATGLLACLPNTFHIRFALLPITLWSAFHTATALDFSLDPNNPRLAYMNQGLMLGMLTIAMRTIDWTFVQEPLLRQAPSEAVNGKPHSNGADRSTKSKEAPTLGKAAWDALELMFNLRGIGWNWSKGLKVPVETRPTTSRSAFLSSLIISFVKDLIVFDCVLYFVQSMSPSTFGGPAGGTIFDASLPPVLRYMRSSFISALGSLTIYNAITYNYELLAIIGVFLLRQSPSQWPPLFDAPWKSESINELWSFRWHQGFRRCFISTGSVPLGYLFGSIGAVMGAFLVSGVLHYVGLWAMGNGTDFWRVAGYFLLGGVGCVLESYWKKVTGKKVQGWYGWTWTMLWSIGWSNMLVDSWARGAMVGSMLIPDSIRPAKLILDIVHRVVARS